MDHYLIHQRYYDYDDTRDTVVFVGTREQALVVWDQLADLVALRVVMGDIEDDRDSNIIASTYQRRLYEFDIETIPGGELVWNVYYDADDPDKPNFSEFYDFTDGMSALLESPYYEERGMYGTRHSPAEDGISRYLHNLYRDSIAAYHKEQARLELLAEEHARLEQDQMWKDNADAVQTRRAALHAEYTKRGIVLSHSEKTALQCGRPVDAIKSFKKRYNLGLREAKDVCDHYRYDLLPRIIKENHEALRISQSGDAS